LGFKCAPGCVLGAGGVGVGNDPVAFCRGALLLLLLLLLLAFGTEGTLGAAAPPGPSRGGTSPSSSESESMEALGRYKFALEREWKETGIQCNEPGVTPGPTNIRILVGVERP
jgi:hypothetical protein